MVNILVALTVPLIIIAMFVGTIILIINLFTDFEFMTLLLTIFMVILCLIPIGMGYDAYQKRIAQQQIVVTDVEITSKVYHPATTRILATGKTTTIIPVSAKYLIAIKSEEHTQTIDNKDTYNAFEVGDRFKMNLILYINKNGKVFTSEFKFIQ